MIISILVILILVIWVLIYIKNNKALYALPYLMMMAITPIYNFLDDKVFVKIFGCGCVPIAQTNILNNDFNANDLRFLIYNIIAIIGIIVGLFISKKMKNRTTQIIYVLLIAIFNFILAFKICKMFMWM